MNTWLLIYLSGYLVTVGLLFDDYDHGERWKALVVGLFWPIILFYAICEKLWELFR